MLATLLETTDNPAPKPGDLVVVEVPLNCTIHSADAARLASLRVAARELRDAIKTGKSEAVILRLAYGVSEFADVTDADARSIVDVRIISTTEASR